MTPESLEHMASLSNQSITLASSSSKFPVAMGGRDGAVAQLDCGGPVSYDNMTTHRPIS